MGEETEKKSGLKVQDKRRFDEQGQERTSKSEPEAVSSAAEDPGFEIKPSAAGEQEALNFSSFVMSLGTQTLMLLGHIKAPPGVDIGIDKAAAKQTIDILSMLEEKTKGNLDPAEKKLIEEILYSLRLAFVKTA